MVKFQFIEAKDVKGKMMRMKIILLIILKIMKKLKLVIRSIIWMNG